MQASQVRALAMIVVLAAGCAGSTVPSTGATSTPTTGTSPTAAATESVAAGSGAPGTPSPTPTTTLAPTSTSEPTSTPTRQPTTAPTVSPTPKPTSQPTLKATASPTQTATPRPTQTATPRPTPEPTPTSAAVTLSLAAKDFVFSPTALAAPAGLAFKIAFRNDDASIPHNVVVNGSGGGQVFSGAIITGVSKTTYSLPALTAGDYTFACIVHPTMTGSLSVR